MSTTNSVLLNGVDRGGMTFTGVWTQDVEEIGKFRHCNGLIGFLIAEIIPVLVTGAAIPTYQFDIILR